MTSRRAPLLKALATATLVAGSVAACSGGGGSPSPSPPASPPSSPPSSPPASPPTSPPPSPPTSPPSSPPPTPQSPQDVVYGPGLTTGQPINLHLDIYQSGEVCAAPRPYVILIHGGGFTSGERYFPPFPQIGAALADRGYVALSIEYRLESDNPVPSAEFEPVRDRLTQALQGDVQLPAAFWAGIVASSIEDTVTAIRWAADNAAEQCIDPNRFAIWGSSAGSYIALYTGYGLDEDNINVAKPGVVIDYWGRLLLDNAVSSTDPRLFILHETGDPVVDYAYAQELQAQADAAFLPYSFYTVTGNSHGFGDIDLQATTIGGVPLFDVTFDFINEHLVGANPTYETRTIPQRGG